jgi:hypothetical protein
MHSPATQQANEHEIQTKRGKTQAKRREAHFNSLSTLSFA